MNEKFNLYEAGGVIEYWVVHPKDRCIQTFILQETGKYDEGTLYERTGNIPVHIFDGCTVNIEELF